jgi:thiazole synthase ThiGH ThiG subunit
MPPRACLVAKALTRLLTVALRTVAAVARVMASTNLYAKQRLLRPNLSGCKAAEEESKVAVFEKQDIDDADEDLRS